MVRVDSIHNHRVLSLNFCDHELSSISNCSHREGREPVGKHSSEKKASESIRVKDVHLNALEKGVFLSIDKLRNSMVESLLSTSDEGAKESKGD